MKRKAAEAIGLTAGILGALAGLIAVVTALTPLILPLPQLLRMLLLFAAYWLIALIPLTVMRVQRDTFRQYGFSAKKLPLQILHGIAIGGVLAAFLVLPPYLIGFGALWDNGCRFGTALWRYLYEFCYKTFAVAAVEELVFRGFCMTKLKRLTGSAEAAAAISALLFGAFHFFGGSMVQIIMTALIGAVLALCRIRLKHCSLLSVIIAHGLYDFIISCAASLTHIS